MESFQTQPNKRRPAACLSCYRIMYYDYVK